MQEDAVQELVARLQEAKRPFDNSLGSLMLLHWLVMDQLSKQAMKGLTITSPHLSIEEYKYWVARYIDKSVEDWFYGYFNETEGSAFSADKGRYVARSIIESMRTGEVIAFDTDKYWSPKSISDTDEAKILYANRWEKYENNRN